jgi:acyl carrier protein
VIEQAPGARDLEGLRAEVRTFIAKAFKGRPLADEEDIFATGFVNSLFAMELVTFIEGTFGITVESDDLDFDNFRTIDRVAEFVARKDAARDRPASATL